MTWGMWYLELKGALDEFYKLCLTHKMMTDGGLDYARNVLEKAFGENGG